MLAGRTGIIISVVVAALLIRLFAFFHSGGNTRTVLRVVASGTNCIVQVNGATIKSIRSMPRTSSAGKIGFYTFHSFETPDDSQRFVRLSVGVLTTNGLEVETADPGKSAEAAGLFARSSGWRAAPGNEGLFHEGGSGDRSVCLLRNEFAPDFELEAVFDNAVDCGVMFRASDERNGLVLAIRPEKNDILLFNLCDGVPEPYLAMEQYRDLDVLHESIRVASLVSDLILRCCVFAGLLWLLVRFLPPLPTGFAARLRLSFGADSLLPHAVVLIASFIVLSFVALKCFKAIPHVTDEVAYLFQARIFAAGHLSAPVPELKDFFAHEHLIMRDGMWFSKYPPLFSAVLALGVLAGPFWLVNPLIGALTALVVFLIIRRLAGTFWGLAGWVLLITSPTFLFMGGNMMAHMLAALFLWLFVLLLFRGGESGRQWPYFLSGLCLGAAAMTRPFTALLFSIPFGVWLAVKWWQGGGRASVRPILCVLAGALPFVCLYFLWEHQLSGALLPGASLYGEYSRSDTLGFGPDKGIGWYMTWGSFGHTPAKALRSLYNYLEYFSRDMFGWPFRLSLCLGILPFVFRRKEESSVRRLFASVFLLLVAGHMLYWAAWYIFFGVRYWFCAFPGLVVLSILGLRSLVCVRADEGSSCRVYGSGSFVAAILIGGLICWNLIVHVPERFKEGPNYGNTSDALQSEVERLNLHKSIVFVKTMALVFNDGFWMNDPFMRSDLVFAIDRGGENAKLQELYPGWKSYMWDKKKLRPAGDLTHE